MNFLLDSQAKKMLRWNNKNVQCIGPVWLWKGSFQYWMSQGWGRYHSHQLNDLVQKRNLCCEPFRVMQWQLWNCKNLNISIFFWLCLWLHTCTSLVILWKPDCLGWKQKWKKKTTKWITVLVPMQAVIKPINNRWVWGRCLMKQKRGCKQA